MPLQYYIIPNHVTPDPDDYKAVSISSQTCTLEDVAREMTGEGMAIPISTVALF